jgi:hypothetical protein
MAFEGLPSFFFKLATLRSFDSAQDMLGGTNVRIRVLSVIQFGRFWHSRLDHRHARFVIPAGEPESRFRGGHFFPQWFVEDDAKVILVRLRTNSQPSLMEEPPLPEALATHSPNRLW